MPDYDDRPGVRFVVVRAPRGRVMQREYAATLLDAFCVAVEMADVWGDKPLTRVGAATLTTTSGEGIPTHYHILPVDQTRGVPRWSASVEASAALLLTAQPYHP